MPLERLQPGDTEISASTWNTFVEVAGAHARRQLNSPFDTRTAFRQATYVKLWNVAGDVEPFTPMWVSDVMRPGDNGRGADTPIGLDPFAPEPLSADSPSLSFSNTDKGGLVFAASSVGGGLVANSALIIPVEPIHAGEVGWGVISGVVPCYCYIPDNGSTSYFADFDLEHQIPSDGSRPCLKVGRAGPAQLVSDVYLEDEETTKLCMIRIGNDRLPELQPFVLIDDLDEYTTAARARFAYLQMVPPGTDTPILWHTGPDGEVEIDGTHGWTGYAVGRDPDDGNLNNDYFSHPPRQGDIVQAYYDRDEQKYFAVGSGQFNVSGTYHEDNGDKFIRCRWREDWPNTIDLPITLLELGSEPEEGDEIVAFYKHSGWVALTKEKFAAGCGIEIDEDDGNKISVAPAEIAGDGLKEQAAEGEGQCKKLAVDPGCGLTIDADKKVAFDPIAVAGDGLDAPTPGTGTCAKLAVKADCGISVSPDGVKFDNAAVAGTGLTPEGDCGLAVDLDIGCGLVGGGASVAFNATAVAGGGLIPSAGCVLNVGAGDGIEVTADEVKAKIACGLKFVGQAIEFDPDTVAGDGLQVGEDCGLEVKPACGIAVDENGVRVYRPELIDPEGGLQIGSGTCDLAVKPGCGIAVDENGVRFYPAEAAGDGLQPSGASPGCALEVKAGCGIVVTPDLGVSVDNAALAGPGLIAGQSGCDLEVDPGKYPNFQNCAAWIWCGGGWNLIWCGSNGACNTPPSVNGTNAGEVKILCNCNPFTTTTTAAPTTTTPAPTTTTTPAPTTTTTTLAPTTTTAAPTYVCVCVTGVVNLDTASDPTVTECKTFTGLVTDTWSRTERYIGINGHGYSVSWCDIYRNGVLAGTMLNQYHTGTTSITSVASGSCDTTTTTTAAPTTTTTAAPTTTSTTTTAAPGSIALVQSKLATDSGSGSVTCTYDAATTANNLLAAVVWAKIGNFAGAPTITAPAGWTERKTETSAGSSSGQYLRMSIYTKENAASESSSTWSYSNAKGTGAIAVHFYEFSGLLTASATDQSASSSNSSLTTTGSTGTTGTTAQANELTIGGIGTGQNAGTITFSAETNSFTSGLTADYSISRYRIVAATGTYGFDATLSGNTNYAGAIVTLKGA